MARRFENRPDKMSRTREVRTHVQAGDFNFCEPAKIRRWHDSCITGTAVYINPAHVIALRPDPADPDHVSTVKLHDGESIQVQGVTKKSLPSVLLAVEWTLARSERRTD